GPITVDKTTTVKARTFWSDDTSSEISEFKCKKVKLRKGKKVKGLKPGLRVTYYEPDETWQKLPNFSSLHPKGIAVLPSCDLAFAERDENIGLTFEGYITVPADGIYTFYSNSDDGSILYVDSVEVVNNDFNHPMSEIGGKIALEAGTYRFKLLYYQGRGGKGLEVSIKGPGVDKQQIPPEMLFYK
ncbi:MAG: PA14 domain-containing protein, partial [Planctomycetota bacterium]